MANCILTELPGRYGEIYPECGAADGEQSNWILDYKEIQTIPADKRRHSQRTMHFNIMVVVMG